MKLPLLGISAAAALGFGYYGSRKWGRPEVPAQQKTPPLEIAYLSELSYLWTDDEVEIRDASLLWREQIKAQASQPSRPVFRHGEIEKFFRELIEHRPSVHGARRVLIIKILTMLDEEGDCPSVVRKNKNEAERIYSDDTYALLETVPLYRHSLTVARNFIAKADQEALMADMIIIALAHDIGKIPSYHDSMYNMGDHPMTAGLILKGIPEFMSLPNKDDILRAIGGHHLLKSDNILTDGLKMSDHDARQNELAELYSARREQMKQEQTKQEQESGGASQAPVRTEAAESRPPEEPREHPLGDLESRENFSPNQLDLPAWFDAEAILTALKKRINVVETTPKGDQWWSVSTPQGLVFVKTDGLWAALRDVRGDDPALVATEAFESEKRNLLYTVVRALSTTRDAIANQYVADRYYTTQVSVVTGGGRRLKELLIPFKAQAFGEKPSALEELKTPRLKRMVRDVIIKQTEVERCV